MTDITPETEPVAVLYGAEAETATLYEDGEHVYVGGQGAMPVCSEHGLLGPNYRSNRAQCDHPDPWGDGDSLSIPTFEVDDVLFHVEATRD
jgi:hypothetical protein